MLPFDLDDWLNHRFQQILTSQLPSTEHNRLLYELWIFDTQVRNGGVSQYFCNYPERWQHLLSLLPSLLPEFLPVANAIDAVVSGCDDPYEAILDHQDRLEDLYYDCQLPVFQRIKTILTSSS